jgi:hypothetical protein
MRQRDSMYCNNKLCNAEKGRAGKEDEGRITLYECEATGSNVTIPSRCQKQPHIPKPALTAHLRTTFAYEHPTYSSSVSIAYLTFSSSRSIRVCNNQI